MSKNFGDVNGSAKSNKVTYHAFKDGINNFRLVGGILPRYIYWKDRKSVECLSFNRDTESFDNVEKDWFSEFFPDIKCSWAYVVQAINLDTGEVRPLGMKKKLWEQIIETSEELGDPTDPVTGWDLVIERKKTGNNVWDISYSLKSLKCKARELTDDEKALIADLPDINEQVRRATPEQQKAYIEKVFFDKADAESEAEAEAVDELEKELLKDS